MFASLGVFIRALCLRGRTHSGSVTGGLCAMWTVHRVCDRWT
eukprot:COSAG01_NODE_44027_length_423_cov_0.987654_1_plen_41_part_10